MSLSLPNMTEGWPTKRRQLVPGERFGKLVVLEKTARKNNEGAYFWKFRCDCGAIHESVASPVKGGKTKSCGCYVRELNSARMRELKTTHGKSGTKTHRIWVGMKGRCDFPSHSRYAFYGGRGIGYDLRWSKFENFLSDMGECPQGMELDRIDNNLGYSKENCRWVTHQQNGNNTRANHFVEIGGARRTIAEWSRLSGINRRTLSNRLKAGRPLEFWLEPVGGFA